MGGRPLAAMALMALGYRQLSITPAGIGPVKAMVRSLDLAALVPEFDGWLKAGRNMRAALQGWSEMNGVVLPGR
jgi:phosphotransferase system enzyme I (PtsP)